MGTIPGYDITVSRNGEDISDKIVSGATRLEIGKLSRSWELEFAGPVDLAPADRWTVMRRLAGCDSVWCQDAPARNFGGQDSVDSASKQNLVSVRSARRVFGDTSDTDTNELLTCCIPRTLVFVNEQWLLDLVPTAKVVGGILVYGGVGPGGLDASRIYHPRLPGREYESNSFECIVGVQTHHDIARYLARLIGYRLVANTPNIAIIDTYTVSSGTTWFGAIEAIFKTLWRPAIEVRDFTFFVSDFCPNATGAPAVQKITLTDDAIASASQNVSTRHKKQQPVDHLIITGRRTNNTTLLRPEDPDYTPVELPEIEVTPKLSLVVSRTFKDKEKYKQMGEFQGSFGLPGEQIQPGRIKDQTHEMHYHIEERGDRRRYVLTAETITTYDQGGTLIARREMTYRYGKGFVPTRSIDKQYVLTNLPGTSEKQLHLVATKSTIQRHCRKAMNLTLTEEIFEGLVLYEKVVIDGQEYKVDPMVLADVLRADTTRSMVDSSADTKQAVVEMTISERSTSIFRTDDNVLVKHEQTYDVLTGHTRSNSQILENPQRDRESKMKAHIFRKEYFHGPGRTIGEYGPCYHQPKTIHHDDIATEEIADKVAQRVFARKDIDMNHEWTIKIPFPVPIESLASIVTLPDFQARVNGVLVTVPGGDFVLRSVTETFSFDGNDNNVNINVETTLVVRAKY